MRVGFLGTGTIAAAMVCGLAGRGHQIVVSDRGARVAADLAARFPDVRVGGNTDVVTGADVVVLCLMARVAGDVLPGLPWRAGQAVISVMADAPLPQLRGWCAPATDIAVTIPLPQIARGGCPLPVFPDSPALRALWGDRNPVMLVRDEAALNAHFIATALTSVTLSALRDGAGWLARHTGDRAGAEAYVAGVIAGALGTLPVGGMGAALEDLATAGGLNLTLRRHVEGVLRDAVIEGMDALAPRMGLGAQGKGG